MREVERLADAVESLPDNRPTLALLDGNLAFRDLQRGQYPRYVADILIGDRLSCALARLHDASRNGRPVVVAAYTSRPRTAEVAGAVRLMLCDQGDGDCNRLCTARRSDLPPCDGAAGFDDSSESFERFLYFLQRQQADFRHNNSDQSSDTYETGTRRKPLEFVVFKRQQSHGHETRPRDMGQITGRCKRRARFDQSVSSVLRDLNRSLGGWTVAAAGLILLRHVPPNQSKTGAPGRVLGCRPRCRRTFRIRNS